MSVAVVGAGIIGLGAAVAIQQLPNAPKVTLISEKFSPETTGDGAAGIWGPFLLGDTPPEKVRKWAAETHHYIHQLWLQDIGGNVGISMIPCRRVSSDDDSIPDWKDIVFGFRDLSKDELRKFPVPSLIGGSEFVTFTCEPVKMLPYLLELFTKNGGIVERRQVTNLDDLGCSFDIVVNCSGINARELVGDKSVIPKRGQVMRVHAPEQNHAYLDDSDIGNYIIPNQDSVVLGGTHQEDDWNLKTYPEDTQFIKDGCYRLSPSLKHAKIIREWVGLRPGRPSVRLETEQRIATGRKPYTLIHNYGHGGSGITLFWGCANDTAALVQQNLIKNHRHLLSKL